LQATCSVSSKINSEVKLRTPPPMRKVKHITVAVPVDLYRQTRRLAAEYDTTVTAMVAYLLERPRLTLRKLTFPRAASSTGASADPANWTLSGSIHRKLRCKTVRCLQPKYMQPLRRELSSNLQHLYASKNLCDGYNSGKFS
jgi:hypothetical protein